MRCIGFGDREDRCEEDATTPAGIWCPGCEAERRGSISAAFERVGASFAAELAREGMPE